MFCFRIWFGSDISSTDEDDRNSCSGIPTKVNLDVYYTDIPHTAEYQLLKAQLTFEERTWRWKCAGISYADKVNDYSLDYTVSFTWLSHQPKPRVYRLNIGRWFHDEFAGLFYVLDMDFSFILTTFITAALILISSAYTY